MTGTVYFIECGGRIKVGYSKRLERRLRDLSMMSALPVKFIGHQDGTKRLEKAIHRYLWPHHAQGEWFFDCAHVRAVISEIILIGGEAIGFQEPVQDPAPQAAVIKSAPVAKNMHGQFSSSLKRLAEPLHFGDRTKVAIQRAATRAGLSYWRAFDIWYGKARRIESHEAERIEAALAA